MERASILIRITRVEGTAHALSSNNVMDMKSTLVTEDHVAPIPNSTLTIDVDASITVVQSDVSKKV